MPKLRAAIIGTGNIARQHATGLLAHADCVELVGVHDIDHARATAFAATRGQPPVFATAAELLATAKPDLVHICKSWQHGKLFAWMFTEMTPVAAWTIPYKQGAQKLIKFDKPSIVKPDLAMFASPALAED